jgi:hypothetical protein
MAILFAIPADKLASCVRQGDLLFRPVTIITQERTTCRHCGRAEQDHVREDDSKYGPSLHCFAGGWDRYEAHTVRPPVLEAETEWEIAESHRAASPSLRHNGRYFAATDPIEITHTSHAAVTLPAGEYRLYQLQVAGD